jgi:hypothetical protein
VYTCCYHCMHVDINAVSHVLLGVLHQCESSAAVLGAEYG